MKGDLSVLGIYAIFDSKGKRFDTPFFATDDLYAKRRFLLMMDEENSPILKWAKDFSLHRVGKFDINDGKVTDGKELIFEAASYVKIGKDEEK